jgi:iron complex outermembrane recepter protein
MMKRYSSPHPAFFFILFLFLPFVHHAQVTGKVTDSTGAPLPFSTVMLIRAADSSVVTGTTANEAGQFSLEKKSDGLFRVMLIFSGYENQYSDSFALSSQQHAYDVGTLVMHDKSTMLDGVQIVASKPFMEQKIDRTIFNIENSVLATGNSALDVLRKLPGVTVDNSDNISVRGKQGVQFLIDGRRSYMSGPDMASYLRGIDASQLERIEVITNPSAKYDAAGNAIINIVMKKNKNLGYNQQLNADYEQGIYYGASINTNLNYKTEKWNFFGGGGFGQWKFMEESRRTVNYEGDSAFRSTNNGYEHLLIDGMWNYQTAGIDYLPGKRHAIGVVFERSNGQRVRERQFDNYMYSSSGELDSNLSTSGREPNEHVYLAGDINYKFSIDTTGRELTADFNMASFSMNSRRENITTNKRPDGAMLRDPFTQVSDLDLGVTIIAGQIDYVHPLRKDGMVEGGIKASHVVTESDAHYLKTQNGILVNDTGQTNYFLYTEIISAGYLNVSKKLNDKWDVQGGLRAEHTISKGEGEGGVDVFRRDYLRLFPSVFLNWKVDSLNGFNISYSRRIDRPDYGELNPFVFYVDPFNTTSGNPGLLPQINHRVEVTYIFKSVYRAGISYMNMNNVFNRIATVNDSTRVFNARPENLATYNVFTLEISGMHPVTSWYTISGTALVFRDHYFGEISGGDYDLVNWTWLVFMQNRISLKKDWSLEANIFYRSVNFDGVWRQKPFSGIDVGVRKRFGNGRGSVALTFNDIFRQNYLSSSADYGNVNMSEVGYMDSRRVRLAISWKLGRSQYEREQRRQSASEEKNRAQ